MRLVTCLLGYLLSFSLQNVYFERNIAGYTTSMPDTAARTTLGEFRHMSIIGATAGGIGFKQADTNRAGANKYLM